MRLYSVTQEQMTAWFVRKAAARRFNAMHDEPETIDSHDLTAAEVAELLNELEGLRYLNGGRATTAGPRT